ncbi:MAG: HigA family addiction module antidote protein [Candidatus Kapabacteria bacterium]|nr:HigA family addiction module antidote protein [Candidatus Kapabacteria bacterium]
MKPTNRRPTHPGLILLTEFIEPMKMTQVELAERLAIPIQRINTIIRGKRGVSAETAVLLSREFGTTPEFWLNLQMACDLYDARARLGELRP